MIGALAGLAIGTLVASLYGASTLSEALKSKAGKKGKAYSKGLKKAVNKFLAKATNKVDSAKDEGADLMKKGKAEAHKAKEKLESALN